MVHLNRTIFQNLKCDWTKGIYILVQSISYNLKQRAIERRVSTARMPQEKRGLPIKGQTEHSEDCFWSFSNAGGPKRDLAELQVWEEYFHEKNSTGYTVCTPQSVIFGAKTSCVLTPEDTVGPYYVS
jgi:hypothetical protein